VNPESIESFIEYQAFFEIIEYYEGVLFILYGGT
jgi:hypothetical protein